MGNVGNALKLCPTEYEEESFDAQYEVDEQNHIGTGKFAVVHLCWRRNQPEKRYALKVINTKVGDMASLNRIREEITILQMLGSHPNIVTLNDVDETLAGTIRLVMELCEGGELYDRIQQKQYYPEMEAKACCRALLDAVAFIHGKGVMHRDLKPENILLASKVSNTDVKISDFGLAKVSRDFPRRLPRSHSICGSDFYLAPEVIKQEEYGREIDIWALGVISYVLLSGSLPFFHNVLHKLYRQIVERDLSFPEQAWKNVSKGALDFILRLLQVRAGDRFTAEQALQHPWLRGVPADGKGHAFGDSAVGFGGSRVSPDYYSSGYSHDLSTEASHYGGHAPYPMEHAHKVTGPADPRASSRQYNGSFGGTPTSAGNYYSGGASPAGGGGYQAPGFYPYR